VEPAEGLAKVRLGLRSEGEDEAMLDQELLAPADLEASKLEREVLAAVLGGAYLTEAIEKAWRALELEGRAPLGALGHMAKRESWERIEAWRRALPGGGHRIHRFGPGEGPSELPHEALQIETEVDGTALTLSLEGRTRFVHADHLVEVDRGKGLGAERKLARQLRLLVDQTVLAAAGLPAPGRFLLVDGDGKVSERAVSPPRPEAARARLAAWIRSVMSRGPIRRLPAAYARTKRLLDPADWIRLQDRRREPWSTLPGSVLRRLPSPDRATALRELEFRLGPLLETEEVP
jgi:hypothetical protein